MFFDSAREKERRTQQREEDERDGVIGVSKKGGPKNSIASVVRSTALESPPLEAGNRGGTIGRRIKDAKVKGREQGSAMEAAQWPSSPEDRKNSFRFTDDR